MGIKIWPHLQMADPICTCLFAVIVCFTTIPVIKTCVLILMESTPSNVDMEEFMKDLNNLEGVENVHDLHVWSLTEGKPSMSAHISGENTDKILRNATICARKRGIYHSTIQVENSQRQNIKGGMYYIDCDHNLH